MAENLYASGSVSGGCATPTNAVGSTSGTWTTNIDNDSWTHIWDLDNPAGGPPASGTVDVLLRVRHQDGTGNPTIDSVRILESGTQRGINSTGWTVTSATGQDITLTVSYSGMTNWANAQIEIATTAAGGAPAARSAVQVDYMRVTTFDPPTYELREWRFRDHDNFTVTANSTSWGVAQDTAPTLDTDRGLRLRTAVAETAGNGAASESFRLAYRINTGSWGPVAVNSPGNPNVRTAIDAVEIRRIQTTSLENTATTQLLSSPDTFVAGQLKTSTLTATASPDSSTTEIEWSLWCHRTFGSLSASNVLNDGDTIEFRVEWDDGGAWTPITPVGSNPSFTVNIPDRHIGGVIAENLNKPDSAVYCDANGNLYTLGEWAEAPTANSLGVIRKSTDGGVTWTRPDLANGPTFTDFEGFDWFAHPTLNELWIFVHNDATVRMVRFGLSNHTTSADQWVDATGQTIESVNPTDQSVRAVFRADGTTVAVYTGPNGIRGCVRSSGSGGTWGTPFDVWTGVTNGDRGVGGVLVGTNFVVFNVDSVWDLYAKVINSSNALNDLSGGTTDAAAAGEKIADVRQYQPWLGALALSSSSFVIGYLVDATPNTGRTRVVTGVGSSVSIGAEQAAINASNWMAGGIGLSNQPAATMVLHPDTGDLYAIWGEEATENATTNTFKYAISTDNGSTWGTAVTIDVAAGRGWGTRIQNVVASIYTRSGGRKLGVIYSDASLAQQDEFTNAATFPDWGGFISGWTWFWELNLGGGTQSIAVGAASETETAVAVGAVQSQSISVGVASETETAQPVTADATISIAVGAASETETAVAVAADASTSIAVGAASEVETAIAVGAVPGVVSVAVVAASETETTQPVTVNTAVTVLVSSAAETETAQPIQIDRSVNVNPASETESAVAIAAELTGAPQSITVNPASETESAVAVAVNTSISIAVGAAGETETAVATGIATTVTIAVTAASEVETAVGIATDTAISIVVSPSAETETAVAIVVNQGQSVAVGAASETETAQAIQIDRSVNVSAASEVETAQTVVANFSQSIAVGAASETETAVAAPPVLGTVVNVLPASETETAVAVTPVPGAVSISIGPASETESAQPVGLVLTTSVDISPATETETAIGVTIDTAISVAVSAAAETETGFAVAALPSISVSVAAATETESAQIVAVVTAGAPQSITVNPASETETAVGVTADTTITVAVTAASEIETAIALQIDRSVNVDPAAETETAIAVGMLQQQIVNVVVASESETAIGVGLIQQGGPQTIPVVYAQETESAVAIEINQDQSISISAASETETAQSVPVATSYTVAIGAAAETESAVAVGAVAGNVNVTVSPAAEVETARPVGINGNVIINVGPASETETAFTTTVDTSYSVSIGWAQEVETAVAVLGVFPAIIAVGPASETETAYSVGALGQVPDVVVTNITLTDNGARSVIVNDTGRRSVDVRYYSGA